MALSFISTPVDVPSGNGDGAAVDVGRYVSLVLATTGTWSASLQLELSYDGGTTWVAFGDPITDNTAVALGDLGDAATHARVVVSGYVSGDPEALVRGLDVRYL